MTYAKKKFKNYVQYISMMDGAVDTFKADRKHIIREGRRPDAEMRMIQEAKQKAQARIQAAATEILKMQIEGTAAVKKMVKENPDFGGRQYHSQSAHNLLQNMTPEQILNFYEEVMQDEAARPFKGEYDKVIAAKLRGTDYGPAFDVAREKHMTLEERVQENAGRALDIADDHIKMVKGLAQEELEKLGRGEDRNLMSLGAVWQAALDNLDGQLSLKDPADVSFALGE